MIAIDPGINGGIAWTDGDRIVQVMKMPDGMTAIADELCTLRLLGVPCLIENVGGYMPGNSATAAVKFARHVGHLEAICYCLGISVVKVAPNTWMTGIGTYPKDKAERKRAIKEDMARRYPHLNVTLATADALGILTYGLKRVNE
jgi:hypothetical protein